MKYVLYNLKWRNGIGDQPYQAVASTGASLDGGIIVNGPMYFGYLTGTEEQCAAAIAACAEFNLSEISLQEALTFVATAIPLNTESVDTVTKTVSYSGAPYADTDGKIVVPWTPTKN